MGTPSALLGREQASALVLDAIAGARRGHGALLLVAGEPGIGKTALVSQIAGERASGLARTAWGRAVDGLGSPAYWPWTQVCRQLGVIADGEHLGDAFSEAPGQVDDRFRLLEHVVTRLEQVSRDGGLLVVIDDLHWADADSLALVELVGRSVVDRPIALVGTYRDAEAGPSLQRLARSAEVLTLSGLSRTATAQLMGELGGRPATPDEVARMHRRTGGNPFFIRELTRLGQLRAEAGQDADAVDIVGSVRDVIERRLARLSQPCTRLLVTAAMDGPTVRPWVLRRVAGGDTDVPALLDEAAEARILRLEADGFRFAHDLFREVIVLGLPATARRTAHLNLARGLEAGRGEGRAVQAAELAEQFSSGAAPEDPTTVEAAVRYAREAARESALRLAFDDAAAHLRQAMSVVGVTDCAPGTRLDLLLEVAGALHVAGRVAEAAATYREAWEAAQNIADPNSQARASLGLHAVGTKTGPSPQRDAQTAMLESAIAAVEPLDPALACEVRAALARTLYHSLEAGRMARARTVASDNLAAARALGGEDVLIAALRARHDVEWGPGTASRRLAVLEELEGLVGPDDGQLRLLRAQALLELGDPQCIVLVDDLVVEAELTGRPAARWLAASRRAASALMAGRVDDAQARIDQAEAIALRLGDDDARWIADIQRWELARFTGGRAGYARHRPDGEPMVERWPPWQALILADAGRGDDAARTLEGFRSTEAYGPGVNAGYDLWFPAIAAEAAARCGSDQLRAGLYDLLAPYAGAQVGCGAWVAYCGPVDAYLADLALARGDTAVGSRHLEAAEQQCLRLGAPLWLARLHETASRKVGAALHRNAFIRNGSTWTLTYAGVEAVVPDAKGLSEIAALLARPHESITAAELAGAAPPDRGEPVLDRRALASYRSRLEELGDEIDDADANHDLDRAHRARMEHEALLDELRRSTGRLGQPRRLGDDSERVRKTIRARVHRAIVQIEQHHPQLADHLRDSVQTGGWCVYRPAQPTAWTVGT